MVALALASAVERLQCTWVSFQLEIPEEFYSVVFRTFYKRCCLIKINTQVILNYTYQMHIFVLLTKYDSLNNDTAIQ